MLKTIKVEPAVYDRLDKLRDRRGGSRGGLETFGEAIERLLNAYDQLKRVMNPPLASYADRADLERRTLKERLEKGINPRL
jgi:molybdenum-dependent DNA-binding transcriptional regulator ModE